MIDVFLPDERLGLSVKGVSRVDVLRLRSPSGSPKLLPSLKARTDPVPSPLVIEHEQFVLPVVKLKDKVVTNTEQPQTV